MSLFRGRLKVIAPFKFKPSLKAAVKTILFRGWQSRRVWIPTQPERFLRCCSDVSLEVLSSLSMFRRVHAWSGNLPFADKQATTSGAKFAVNDETSCSTCDSPSVFGRKPTGNSAVARRGKVLFEDYDVCAYHIIVCKPRNKTRRSFQQRRQLSSSLRSSSDDYNYHLHKKVVEAKNGDKCRFTDAYHSSCTSLSLKTNVYLPDAISWFFVCFISLYKDWLYGSMIVYKFVIKLSANKEAATKSTWSDGNFKFFLLTLLEGGPRSCSKLLGLFGKAFFFICLTCLRDLRQNFFQSSHFIDLRDDKGTLTGVQSPLKRKLFDRWKLATCRVSDF